MHKAKHAFGQSSGIEAAKQAKKIDSFDILFLDGDTDPKIGWLDRNGETVIVESTAEVKGKVAALETELSAKANAEEVEAAIATKADEADVEALESAMAEKANASDVETLETALTTKVTAEEVKAMIKESEDSLVEIVEF